MPTCARLVWDGSDKIVHVPPQMLPNVPSVDLVQCDEKGNVDIVASQMQQQYTKRPDQLAGTVREIVGELASRVCYDSLGAEKSRSSKDLHAHILEVGNTSVYEHCAFTFDIHNVVTTEFMMHLFNRTCLHVDPHSVKNHSLRVTLNPRHLIDWDKVPRKQSAGVMMACDDMRSFFCEASHSLLPNVIPNLDYIGTAAKCEIAEPQTRHEKWITLFLAGSRGFSHEQVRHGDWTAISQRSTRYVDESESEWVTHPLIREFYKEKFAGKPIGDRWEESANKVKIESQVFYDRLVTSLQSWLISRGIDKFSARKQARGAARGYLGNALYTEMLFSASVQQWRWMLSQRLSDFADAEIREVYAQALIALRESRYAEDFADIETQAASDGLGISAKPFNCVGNYCVSK